MTSASRRTGSRQSREPERASLALTAAAVGAGAVLLLVVLLVVGGGAPEAAVPGLPGAGAVVGWLLPVLRLMLDIVAVGTIGCLLYGAYLVPARDDELRRPAQQAIRSAGWLALAWAFAAGVSAVLTLADISGQPLGELLSSDGFADALVSLDQSRSLLLVTALTALVAVCAWRVRTTDGPTLVLVLAVAALIPPILTGHAATHQAHQLAIVSLAAHVVAVSLWVGGLGALLVFRRRTSAKDAVAVRRFSSLALACFAVTAVSGVVNAVIRLGDGDGVLAELSGSGYGALVLLKLAALGGLTGFGWWHRRHTIDALAAGREHAFRRFAGREVVLMVATIAVAVALSRTPTPAGGGGGDVVEPGEDPGHQHALVVTP